MFNQVANKNKFFWSILFCVFLLISLYNHKILETYLNFDFSSLKGSDNSENSYSLNGFIILALSKLLYLFAPILGVSLFEIFYIRKKETKYTSSLARLTSSKGYPFADVWYYSFDTLGDEIPFIVTFLTLGLSSFNSGISEWFDQIYINLLPASLTVYSSSIFMIIGLLVSDLAAYWVHRFQHRIGFLWDLHEFHHSATEMTILNKRRSTPLLGVITAPVFLPFTVLTALLINLSISQGHILPLIIYVSYTSLEIFCNVLGHSSLSVTLPKPVSFFFMSPCLHWIHHSQNAEHYDKNFGQRFTFWDKLFGTYLGEDHVKEILGFGVLKSDYNKFNPFYTYTIIPVLKLIKRGKYLISS